MCVGCSGTPFRVRPHEGECRKTFVLVTAYGPRFVCVCIIFQSFGAFAQRVCFYSLYLYGLLGPSENNCQPDSYLAGVATNSFQIDHEVEGEGNLVLSDLFSILPRRNNNATTNHPPKWDDEGPASQKGDEQQQQSLLQRRDLDGNHSPARSPATPRAVERLTDLTKHRDR